MRLLLGLALLSAIGCSRASADPGDDDREALPASVVERAATAKPVIAPPSASHPPGGIDPAKAAAAKAPEPANAADARASEPARADEAAPEPEEPFRPCPPEMAHLGRYCIDRWEAHLVSLDPTGSQRRHPHQTRPPNDGWYAARSAPGVFPQAYISEKEAALACERAEKRLCSWLEWRRACQGARWLRYPYGNGERRGVCNTDKKHLLHELFADEKPWKYDEHFNHPRLSLEPGYLAATGAHEACESPAGAFDMVGNLHEWVSTTVTDDFVERMEAEPVDRIDQPWVVGNAMFLGGFYSTRNQHGPGCHYTTIAHEPTYHDYSTGFRCCANAREAPHGEAAKSKETTPRR